MESALALRGFVVHAYVDTRRNHLNLLGRAEDGRSFAVIVTSLKPSFLVFKRDLERCRAALSSIQYETVESKIKSFEENETLYELKFAGFSARTAGVKRIEEAGIASPNSDWKVQDAFLIERGIKGPVKIEGKARQGRLVDLVFRDPMVSTPTDFSALDVPLVLCSIDIETDVKNGTILAVGFSVSPWNRPEKKHSLVRVLSPGFSQEAPGEQLVFHPDEKSLLAAFLDDMAKTGADILTGWNFLDFDYPRLAGRCAFHRIPFLLGRSDEEAKFFPGGSGFGTVGNSGPDGESEQSRAHENGKNPGEVFWQDRRFSAAALVPGRQVIDALRVVRSGPKRLPGYTLEAAAQAVLGEGKAVSSSGEKKLEDLETLYRDNPAAFGAYCLRDAELVTEILDKTGLLRLTLERSSLTGVSLDKAWTSVKAFERVYGLELFSRNIAPPPVLAGKKVSGAAGGTVLEPLTGFFPNVGVFDFRSLYPTIMKTFNIDPLAFARAGEDPVRAPNGAAFSREPGILPELIAYYFEERRKALAAGDEEASFVYKILMNSFYGVLGSSSCRYGKTELAGAITSFAKKWLYFSRDWFGQKGYRVLYGDTDSLFVESGLGDEAGWADFSEWGKSITAELNSRLAAVINDEYGLLSSIELRFEKPYRRFMIPPLRSVKGEGRGRAKGYGGWRLDPSGELVTEVRGMEAVRSDSTPLARRIQVELLEQVFRGGGLAELRAYVSGLLDELRHGRLDGELVYRKRLSRTPEEYTASVPPQVKAAKALGWKNRRGTVEYVWTVSGPEPLSLQKSAPDYDHYADAQVLSVARSIAAAAGWHSEIFPRGKKDFLSDGQMELGF